MASHHPQAPSHRKSSPRRRWAWLRWRRWVGSLLILALSIVTLAVTTALLNSGVGPEIASLDALLASPPIGTVGSALLAVAAAAASASYSPYNFGGRAEAQEEAAYVIVSPGGVLVRESIALDSDVVGALPFGTVVVLAAGALGLGGQHDAKERRVHIAFPYEGFITSGKIGGGGRYATSVRRLVGHLPAAADETLVENHYKLECCDVNATTATTISWDDLQVGRYAASPLVNPHPDQPPREAQTPIWTVQTRPFPPSSGAISNSWLNQVPIGSGKTGALVGGSAGSLVVPLSSAGLYVPGRRSPPRQQRRRQDSPRPDGRSEDGKLFRRAREALLKGDHGTAERLVGEMHARSAGENPMAMFQYAADFALVFAREGVGIDGGGGPAGKKRRQQGVRRRQQQGRRREGRSGSARDGVVDALLSSLTVVRTDQKGNGGRNTTAAANPAASHRDVEGEEEEEVVPVSQLYGGGRLDLLSGIYRESFLVGARSAQGSGETDATAATRSKSAGGGDGALLFNGTAAESDRRRTDGQEESLQLHHREWFAPLDEHVVMGRTTCRPLPRQQRRPLADGDGDGDGRRPSSGGAGGGTPVSGGTRAGCLNLAASLSRTDGGGGAVSSTSSARVLGTASAAVAGGTTANANAEPNDEGGGVAEDALTIAGLDHYPPDSMRAALSLVINPHPSATTAPTVYVCGVVVCHYSASSDLGKEGENTVRLQASSDGGGLVSCSGFDSADFLFAVEVESRGYDMAGEEDMPDDRNRPRSNDDLRSDCEARLAGALHRGYPKSREKHAEEFEKMMNGTDVHFRDHQSRTGLPRMCDGHALSDVLKSVSEPRCGSSTGTIKMGRGRVDSEPENEANQLSPSLLRRQFHFSRYLLLSSASSAVPNLQGLWADGPTSAWNGDYHFNVNLQMMYWGTLAGLSITHRPLLRFIRSLATVGREAARSMYNCSDGSAWAAHGNTDHTLDGKLRAESHWIMCATCGLWAALLLFDHILHNSIENGDEWTGIDLLNALAVLRGNIDFFKQYTFVDSADGVRHTGPTTSPENSYVVLGRRDITPNGNATVVSPSAQHLAFTPAFDASLLRQLANAFPILVQWVRSHASLGEYPQNIRDMDETLAKEVVQLAKELPFGGEVVIGASGAVLEYPTPLASAGTHTDLPQQGNTTLRLGTYFAADARNSTIVNVELMRVMEGPDPGHRHFSGMHWLYPNTFVQTEDNLMKAARMTLDRKISDAKGGHTGWSAGWEASLRARIRDGKGAWSSLGRLVGRFTACNGLALHPPLAGLPNKMFRGGTAGEALPQKCSTCFHESDTSARGSDFGPSPVARGMETSRSDKFQLDGHGGLIAGVAELLLMSHIPGTLLVLPSVASLPLTGGAAFGLRGRGDLSVSVAWSGTGPTLDITTLEIKFSSRHPWLHGSRWAESRGYWTDDEGDAQFKDHPSFLRVYVPNGDELIGDESQCGQRIEADRYKETKILPAVITDGMSPTFLRVDSFPCSINLCSSSALAASGHMTCRSMLDRHRASLTNKPRE